MFVLICNSIPVQIWRSLNEIVLDFLVYFHVKESFVASQKNKRKIKRNGTVTITRKETAQWCD